jgi:hypothetical protein
MVCSVAANELSPPRTNELARAWEEQGATSRRVLGFDRKGLPIVCATTDAESPSAISKKRPTPPPDPPQPVLPAGTRMWETVPGVIRNDGIDTFCVEVDVNGAVSNVVMDVWPGILSHSGQTSITLRDDGLQGDRVAHDFIYTSELLRFDITPLWSFAQHYRHDTNSPAGLDIYDVGPVTITETGGQQNGFLHSPQVGLLRSDIPLVETIVLSSNVIISPHLINVRGTNLSVQKFARSFTLGTADLTPLIYSVLPDAFDFFICFSTYRIERLPYNNGANFNAGVHRNVKVDFTGTGQGFMDNTAIYGSGGRLLGLNGLDCYDRGLLSYNCAHEILHQWGSYLSAFPISDGQHYNPRSNVGSLLGGHAWTTNGDDTWSLHCEEGRSGATHAAPLDKYLMGLIPGNQVPALRVYPDFYPNPGFMCDGIISNVQSTVTIADIAGTYGPRSPGPGTARRDFSLGFFAETHQRMLNRVEMTFYDMLASHYTTAVPADRPDPYVGFNWAPITRFFGENTTWRSDVLSLIQPIIQSCTRLGDGRMRITGSGLPGRTYRLQSSTAFSNWITVANQTAATNGTFVIIEPTTVATNARFYRLVWP